MTMEIYVCRFCCLEKEYDCVQEWRNCEFVALFTSYNKQTKCTFAQMAMECTKVQIAENDGLTAWICWQCVIKLQVAWEFASMALQSQQTLAKQMMTNNPPAIHFDSKQIAYYSVPKICLQIGSDHENEPIKEENDQNTSHFQCPICIQAFEFEHELQEHSQNQHAWLQFVNEKDVPKIVDQKGDRPAIRRPKLNRKYQCSQCSVVVYTLSKHLAHQRVHTGERPFVCSRCPKSFQTQSNANAHAKRTHGIAPKPRRPTCTNKTREFKCDNCDLKFDDEQVFRCHMGDEHYLDGDQIDESIEQQLPLPPPKPQCPHCFKEFKSRGSLLGHVRMHGTTQLPFACADCLKKFRDRPTFAKHMRVNHRNKHTVSTPEWFECVICGKKYRDKRSMNVHMRSHIYALPYRCTQCPRRFVTQPSVRRHLRDVHAFSERAIQNVVQSKTHVVDDEFTASEEQTENLLKILDGPLDNTTRQLPSTNDSKFSCIICGQIFQKRLLLCQHYDTHKTPKPGAYSCPRCLKRFHLRANLRSHMETHTNTVELPDCQIDDDLSKSVEVSLQLIKAKCEPIADESTCICFVCGDKINLKNGAYESHMEQEHVTQSHFKCRLCDFELLNDTPELIWRAFLQLAQHVFARHTTIADYYRTCFVCLKMFKSNGYLTKHLRSHAHANVESPKICTTCGKTYECNARLRQHERTHLSRAEKRAMASRLCAHCGKTFNTNAGLSKHIRIKHCDDLELEQVERITVHGAIELFAKLKREGVLEQHEPLNAALKNQSVCPFCFKEYEPPSTLGRHLRLHFDERPYKCKLCPAACKLKTNLLSHVKSHQGRRYRCALCSTLFGRQTSLRKHISQFHSGEKVKASKSISAGSSKNSKINYIIQMSAYS